MASTRLRRPGRVSRLLPALLLTLVGASTLPAARAANVIQSVSPVIVKGQAVTYDITLYSDTEFPMRDEVIYLSIGGRQFINSRYLQGGTLHTIVFRLTQAEFASLKEGSPVVAYYTQDDSSNPDAQWVFGKFSGVTPVIISRPISPRQPVTGTPEQPITATPDAKRAAKKGQK